MEKATPPNASAQGLGTMSEAIQGVARYYDWVYNQLRPFFGEHILEIGPGFGNMAERIIREGRSYFAIDRDAGVIENLKTIYPMAADHFWIGDLTNPQMTERIAAERPDTILSMNVIEHVEDDIGHLSRLRDLLPGGRLILFVPAMPFLYGSLDRAVGHFRRYTLRSLRSALQNAGFKPMHLMYFNAVGACSWFLSARILKLEPDSGGTKRSILLYDHWVIPFARVMDSFLNPFFGQSLIAVAEVPF